MEHVRNIYTAEEDLGKAYRGGGLALVVPGRHMCRQMKAQKTEAVQIASLHAYTQRNAAGGGGGGPSGAAQLAV